MSARKKMVDFERGLQQLEAIVEALEQGNLSLEDSLKSFEQGVKITRECQRALANAEQRVAILTQGGEGESASTPFSMGDMDSEVVDDEESGGEDGE